MDLQENIKQTIRRLLKESEIPKHLLRRLDLTKIDEIFKEALTDASKKFAKNKDKWNFMDEYKFNKMVVSYMVDTFFSDEEYYNSELFTEMWDDLYNFFSEYYYDQIRDRYYAIEGESGVVCEDCGWFWYLSDGGDDPYVCHKCGNDNTPKKTNVYESIRRILREETETDSNIDGGKLKVCSTKPMTGYYGDGYCRTGKDDIGSHTVCVRVTDEFLTFTNSKGNNLDMLKSGDKWCLCAKRWEEANVEGKAPEIIRQSTNIKTLDIIDSDEQELDEYARTLKNARQQGIGLRFPKSAIRSNPQRFRPYNREGIYESDPKTGTGKKPKGSGRRLYTDENPKDTVSVKFRTKEDIVDTLNQDSFKSKPHKRQSQVINLIHQRVRAAYQNAKDPETKKRLKRAYDYIESVKEKSKEKTVRLRKQEQNESEITERCWAGYTQKGMKTMFGKRYPNCVKKIKK